MQTVNDDDSGGPAFPFEYHNQTSSHQPGFFQTGLVAPGASQQFAGMTLRDYFAAHAPPAPAWWMKAYASDAQDLNQVAQVIAQWAYCYADLMLKERAK